MTATISIHAHQNDTQRFRSNSMPCKSNSNSITLYFSSKPYGKHTYDTDTQVTVFSLNDDDATILAGAGQLPPESRALVATFIQNLINNKEEKQNEM